MHRSAFLPRARTPWRPCLVGLALLLACQKPAAEAPQARTLAEARQLVLDLFGELDSFALEKQLEVGLIGRPAVRMEASWVHEGQKQRGILYVLDAPDLFNVISFSSPAEEEYYDAGYPVFQKMLRSMKIIRHGGPLTVVEQGEDKVMRSVDLQLEIHYPAAWVYTLDEVNRAVVFSGPKTESTWLTTVSFSVLNRWRS
jgi:hypothetical protein